LKGPFSTCNFHAVFYKMPACSLNNAGSNRKPLRKIAIIFKIRRFVEQIGGEFVYRFSFFLTEFFSGGTSAHPASHVSCLSLKNIWGVS